MGQVRDYAKLANDIIREVGGDSNITGMSRCATRLRLVLNDTPTGAKEKISEMPGVITVVENGGQFQVVIGTHVGDVYQHAAEILDIDNNPRGEAEVKTSVVNRIIATMSGVFAPFVYILAAAGILQGILIVITTVAPEFAQTGTYELFSFMSWTPFTYLPIFIAITASKHFKCNTFIAVLCCCALVNPSWGDMAARIADGENIKFLFFNLSETTYASTVIPPLLLVWALSYLERFIDKRLPSTVKPLLTPLICLVVMVPLTILTIGPLSTLMANGIANGYNALFTAAPAVAAAVIGGFWQVAVIFGVHWGITPVVLANFDMYGYDSFQAFQTVAVVAQAAAAFGVFIKSRNKEFKGVAMSAGITGVFGITEPAIYGVTLRLKKPFICGCIAGATGAVVMSFFNSLYYAYAGLPGLLTIVNAISPDAPMSFIGEVVGCGIAIVGSILLVQIIGFDDPAVERSGAEVTVTAEANMPAAVETAAAEPVSAREIVISSPAAGKLIPLSEVPDAVFSSGAMGQGAAVKPEDNRIFAPFDGTVSSIFHTKHAIGMLSDSGVELLIHVGLDTVELEGKPFTVKVEEGAQVKKGDLLLEFDAKAIQDAGYQIITPVIVLNTDLFEEINMTGKDAVSHGDRILEIKA